MFEKLNKDKGVKDRANQKERALAKKYNGRPTVKSGALSFDKADVKIGKVRVEHKHTENESLSLKKEWLLKLKNGIRMDEIPVVCVEIQDEKWFLVRESEFAFILQNIQEKI